MQGLGPPPQPESSSTTVSRPTTSSSVPIVRSKSRFRFLRQAHGPKVDACDHGWDVVLGGARGRQAGGVRRQGRHLVAGRYGNRDRAALHGRAVAEDAGVAEQVFSRPNTMINGALDRYLMLDDIVFTMRLHDLHPLVPHLSPSFYLHVPLLYFLNLL
jgi:hypothetical protein